jgi:hypothetical protein
MSTFVDKELQARLLREIQELYEKRGKIEDDIRALEARSKLRIEKAALQEIDAYKNLNRSRAPSSWWATGEAVLRKHLSVAVIILIVRLHPHPLIASSVDIPVGRLLPFTRAVNGLRRVDRRP